MLDQPPTELVAHVVPLAVCPSSLNLSPPALSPSSWPSSNTEITLILFLGAVESAALGKLVKRLRILEGGPATAHDCVFTQHQLRWLGEHCPNVVEFFYEVSEDKESTACVDLSDMQPFLNLRSLVVHRILLHIRRMLPPQLAHSPDSARNLLTLAFTDLLVRNSHLLKILIEVRQLCLGWDTTSVREYDADWPLDNRQADRVAKALLKLDDLLTDDKLPHLSTLYGPILLDKSVTPMRFRLQYAVRDLLES
ncbi:hypothetical protein JCM8547_005355 [Rhodosporidiobolus lusitaniae]